MAFRPTSLIKTYSDHSPFDPAFVQLEDILAKLVPEPGDTAPTQEAIELATKGWRDAVARCRETSNWSELRVEGTEEPTRFDFQNVSGEQARALMDLERTTGRAELTALWFRAALVGVANFGGASHAVKYCRHEDLPNKIADATIADAFDWFDMRIVAELGTRIEQHTAVFAPRR